MDRQSLNLRYAAAHQFEESLAFLQSSLDPAPATADPPPARSRAAAHPPAKPPESPITLAELEEAAADIERYMQSLG